MNTFWEQLRKVIEAKGLTQGDVARGIGEREDSFRRWSSRGVIPKADKVYLIARFLGVPYEDLVGISPMSADEVAEQAPAYGWTKVQDDSTRAWVGKHSGLVSRLMTLPADRVAILEDYFLNSKGRLISDEHYDVASHLPQKISAGAGQSLLDFPEEDLIQRAPYPLRWGKGLLCAEVIGDSMTGANIFDGDLVYFKPGEIRGDGLYVLQLNGTVLVKRLQFDDLTGRLTIISENKMYQERTESSDSQAISILGKVRGWMHGHPY
jgi:SOS-response transcriptional repressor LexA